MKNFIKGTLIAVFLFVLAMSVLFFMIELGLSIFGVNAFAAELGI